MKESITKEIGKEIAEKKKLPEDVRDEMNKKVFRNLLFASFIILYFIFLNLGYLNIDKSIFIKDTEVFAITCLIISVVLIENAYRKEKGYLAIHGLEVLVVALVTLFTPYTYFYIPTVVSKIMMVVPVVFAMYYVAKGIIICIKTQKNQDKKISDVKEIVKKETRKFDEIIDMDKDKEAEIAEKPIEKKMKKEEKIKTEKVKSARKKKTEEGDNKEKIKTTKKVADKKDEIKPKKTTKATKKVEDKEKNTIPKKKTETTKKKTTTTKKETTEGTKTRKPRVKKEE